MTSDSIHIGTDGQARCWWCGDDPLYQHYHDTEWGRPVTDDRTLFEKLCLEGFQAGLSWITILRKRENFRAAFDHFDINKIALYDEEKIQTLLQDKGIIRHRGKIEATINNAKCAQNMISQHGSIYDFVAQYKPKTHTSPRTKADMNGTSDQSIALSKALKKQGWKFVGPTTVYSFMQAMGIINDHLQGCATHVKIAGEMQTRP